MMRVKLEREPIRSRQCGLIERQAATRYALTDLGAPCWRRCSTALKRQYAHSVPGHTLSILHGPLARAALTRWRTALPVTPFSVCSSITHSRPWAHKSQVGAANSGCAAAMSRQASRRVLRCFNKYPLATVLLHESPNRLRAARYAKSLLIIAENCSL